MRFGVIVTSCNSPQALAACLGGLARQSRPLDEVIVSDDGSDPEPAAAIRTACAAAGASGLPVRLVAMPHRTRSVAAVRNLGIRNASSDYLLFLDGDILPGPEVLTAHAAVAATGRFLIGDRALLDRTQTEALFAANPAATDFDALWRVANCTHLERVERKFRWHQWKRRLGLASRHKPQILACHFSAACADLAAVNGFDERYVDWGSEDDDLAARLYLAGCTSRSVISAARAIHLWHPSRAPAKGAPNPNRAYFRRRRLRARCAAGLVNEPDGAPNR